MCFHAGVAAGFNAPISGVFFAVESVLQRPAAVGREAGAQIGDPQRGNQQRPHCCNGVAGQLCSAAVVSQARARMPLPALLISCKSAGNIEMAGLVDAEHMHVGSVTFIRNRQN